MTSSSGDRDINIPDIRYNRDPSSRIVQQASVREVLAAMDTHNKGVVFVISQDDKLAGVVTDGDIRRGMNKWENIDQVNLVDFMTPNPISITEETPLVVAQQLMMKHEITSLPITDESGRYLGFIDTHELNKILSPERIYPLLDSENLGQNAERHIARYKFAATYIQSEDVVLDCACGAGYGSVILAEKAMSVLGIDISENAVKFAQETYGRENTTYRCSDLNELSFPDESFNLVVSIETLEHVERPVCMAFLKKIRSWIKPGGMLVASTPMLRYQDGQPYVTNPYHVNEMPKDEMIGLFDDVFDGFTTYFFHQKQGVFLPLTSEHTGFCIIVARKSEP